MTVMTSCKMGQDEIVAEVSLNGTYVKTDSINEDKMPLLLSKNLLVSLDYMRGKAYYGGMLSKTELTQSDVLAEVGHGHNEFQQLAFTKGKNNSLYLLNYPFSCNGLESITYIPQADSISTIKDANKWKKYSLRDLPAFFCFADNFVALSDSTILILGTPAEKTGHIISIVDFKNKKISPLDFWPKDNVECDSFPKQAIYTQYSKVYGNGNGKYVYQLGRDRFAFVFSIEGNHVNVIKTLYEVYPDYKEDPDKRNYVINHYNPEGLDCAVSDKNVYMLLTDSDKDGNKLEKMSDPLYGNTVEVYDWDGNKQKVIHLDKLGQRIMISDDNKVLYLFVRDYREDIYEIWSYDLDTLK